MPCLVCFLLFLVLSLVSLYKLVVTVRMAEGMERLSFMHYAAVNFAFFLTMCLYCSLSFFDCQLS